MEVEKSQDLPSAGWRIREVDDVSLSPSPKAWEVGG